ncbi:MAG: amidohydrolase family protein [Candidatus Methylomirabilis sp.]
MTSQPATTRSIIDIHVHVLPPDACSAEAYVSTTQWYWPSFLYLRVRHRMKRQEPVAGNGIIRSHLARAVASMQAVDRVVALALDAVYDESGRKDNRRTHFYVANDYVFQLAKSDDRFLPGASVNPKRLDALAELDRCLEQGAVLLKWLPNSQGFDPMDPSFVPFYRRMAEARLPLLCHTGPEYALTTADRRPVRPKSLRLALDEGVVVIAAHGGGADIQDFGQAFSTIAEMLLTYPNLYADTSAFTQPNRSWFLRRFLRHPELHPKLVHGSDVPLPIIPWLFLGRLPFREIVRLNRVASPMDRDYLIKRALGFPESIFRRGPELLRMGYASP